MTARIFMYIFHYGPCNRDTVVSRRTASKLIKKYERTLAHIVEYCRSFIHLDHESRLSHRKVIRRADTGEYLVDNTYSGRVSRNERTGLSHKSNQRCLSQKRRLTRHIRAGYHHDLLSSIVNPNRVGYIRLSGRKLTLDHRMTSFFYVDFK